MAPVTIATVGLSALPQLMKGFWGGRGEVADLGPAGGDAGHLAHPAGSFGASAEVPLLEAANEAVEEAGFEAPGPEGVDPALEPAAELVLGDVAAHVDQVLGDVDLDGAGFVAGAAEAGGLGEVLEVAEALEERGDQRADGAGVDVAVGVAANLAVDGAGVKAGAA